MIKKQKKKYKNINTGIIHIKSTTNNTLITITDIKGNTISWASAGTSGFKGARKSTPFAAQTASKIAVQKAMDIVNLQKVEIIIKGYGPGRDTAIRALQTINLKISSIKDMSPIPYNGCRPPKHRRI
ncbi:MAG: 30S ribosomal protein S11 [Alphaproteobacteria bacterium]|nr:30S ribosomal protein S11 [Alphaproteobacteria bacterium]